MKSSADQLASLETGISSILGEKQENWGSEKTHNKGIDPKTLAGMPEDIKAQTKEYENFVKVLGTGTSQMDECYDAAIKLAEAYWGVSDAIQISSAMEADPSLFT